MEDNRDWPIFRGTIDMFGPGRDRYGAPTTARILPNTAPEAPTRLFAINWTCRDPRVDLREGDEVWCARSEDGEGIVLARADGDETGRAPAGVTFVRGDTDGSVTVERGDVRTMEGDVVTERGDVRAEAGDMGASGTVTGAVDVVGGGISLKSHTHTGVHGETSGPH